LPTLIWGDASSFDGPGLGCAWWSGGGARSHA